LRNILART